jgi:hypothetical protein
VSYKLHSKALARALWGVNDKGQTWEYIYFVAGLRRLAVPYVRLAEVAGYAPNFVVQETNILEASRSAAIIRGLDLAPENEPVRPPVKRLKIHRLPEP